MKKFQIAIIGATGLVGQTFISLLADHPYFEVKELIASERSAGQLYGAVMQDRWAYAEPMPDYVKNKTIKGTKDLKQMAGAIDFVFSAVDMKKEEIIALEEGLAKLEIPVVSNNSALRRQEDVPMIIAEVNPDHSKLIEVQRKHLHTKRGFVAVKPNCSIQSYVPALTPLHDFGLEKISVCTYQAISGAGKTLASAKEIQNNIIPYIKGEEDKSEWEPHKIWANYQEGKLLFSKKPLISAQCYRVPVEYGHTAAVSVSFRNKPSIDEIKNRWREFKSPVADLPSAPQTFLRYIEEENRPQVSLDHMAGKGMTVSIGRLREDNIFDYKFTCLSHNLIRGAAGGAILLAELLVKQGYITDAS